MEDTTRWTAPKCTICNADYRDQLESELLDGTLNGKQLAAKYHVTESQVSMHKNKHILSAGTLKEHLKTMIAKSINSKMIAPENVGELIRLMEFIEKMQDNIYLDGTKKLEQYKQVKMDKFTNIVNEPLFDVNDKPSVIRLAQYIFIDDDGTKDIGDFFKALIG